MESGILIIKRMESDEDIYKSFDVMSQLRPHLKENEFINIIKQQFKGRYQLVAVLSNNKVLALAGFRINENLAWGKFLYIDDLVTDQAQRSAGYGKMLLDWLKKEAINNQCSQLHLDSGVQRKDAHKFYNREGMSFASHHYSIQL